MGRLDIIHKNGKELKVKTIGIFQNMKEKSKMENQMVKGNPLSLMEESMLGNSKMGIGMVKEQKLPLMEQSM